MGMTGVSFYVEGQPVPKARARTVRKGGKTWSFTPKRVAEWEKEVKAEAEKIFVKPLNGPLGIELIFYMHRPKSRRKETWVTTTPDLDNLEKAVLDGLSGVVYTDDRLVVRKRSEKRYVLSGAPRVEVLVVDLVDQRVLEGFLE
jgi:Holliday junction resolvase RusA-like endonuclease